MNTIKSIMITLLSLMVGFFVLTTVLTIGGYILLAIVVVLVLVIFAVISYTIGNEILESVFKRK